MRNFIYIIFLLSILLGCARKQTKFSNTDREVSMLIERIKEGTADGYYGSLTQQQIERLLFLTSPRYQDKVDERTKEKIDNLLDRIRESNREERLEGEEERERESREVDEN
jgi:hypothetical protein